MKLLFRRFTHKQAHHFPPYHIGSALTTFCRGGVILILTIFRFRARRWIPPFRGSFSAFFCGVLPLPPFFLFALLRGVFLALWTFRRPVPKMPLLYGLLTAVFN